jgi:PKD repeat protein
MVETSEGNSPDFEASATTVSVGNLITFNDRSVIRNNQNMTYLWQFGDGTTSSTIGSVNHVYGLYGVYTVNLTVVSDSGSAITNKPNYITVSQSQSTTFQVPRTVTFTTLDKRMNPLSNIYVTAEPLNFTMPAEWLTTYYGLNSGVNLSGTTLSGYTGSDGSWAAPMSASIRYRMTFSGTGLPTQNITLYPQDPDYVFQLTATGDFVQPTPASQYINYAMGNATIDTTHEYFNLSYQDTSGGTSEVALTVKNSTGAIVYSGTQSGFGTAATTITSGSIVHSPGDSYTYTMSAKQQQLGYVNRTYTITWENLKTLSAYPDWVGQWLGIGLLIILAGVFSIISIKFALVVIPAVTYFMTFYMRWLQPEIGISTFVGCLSVLFVFGVLRYMRESKKKLAG